MSRDGLELEPELRPAVNRHFSVYDSSAGHDHLTFFVTLPADEEKAYDALRGELKRMGYLPVLRRKSGEVLVDIIPAPQQKKPWLVVNILLLVATLGTTILAGTVHWMNYNGVDFGGDPVELAQDFLSSIWGGFVFFSLPLMLILGSHELGHYFMSRRHGVEATLPYFIPSPFTFGTFGAFISVKEPIPTKKALLDIGLAGPVCGLVVAIPVTVLGLVLAKLDPATISASAEGTTMQIGVPLLFRILDALVPGNVDYIHPTAFAGWVGMFVTAINLLPAGQLDGGHVARALLGDKAKMLSIGVIVVLIAMGLIFEWSWILFALIIVFLGISHPPPLNDITGLDMKRVAAGVMAGVIFVACFIPNPLAVTEARTSFDLRVASENSTVEADWGATNASFFFELVNDGDTDADIALNATALNWATSFSVRANGGNWTAPPVVIATEAGETVTMELAANLSGAAPGVHAIWLETRCDDIDRTEEARLIVRVRGFGATVDAGGNDTLAVSNLMDVWQNLTLRSDATTDGWLLSNGTLVANPATVALAPGEEATLQLVQEEDRGGAIVTVTSFETGEAQRVTLIIP